MQKNTRVMAVANEKGGVGKTVTVVNLAAALSRGGKTVLIVDMDPQANATRGLGVDTDEEALTTYDLMTRAADFPLQEAIVSSRWQGLDVIPAHIDLSGAEIELVNETGRENRLKRALASLPARYDFVLLDTPPSLSLLTVNVFACAREVLVPCQTHPYSYAALEELFDTIQVIREEINPALYIGGILATFFDQRTRVSQNILAQLKSDERYASLLFKTVIRANTTIAESAAVGKPLVFYRSGSYGAADYLQLAQEIQNRS